MTSLVKVYAQHCTTVHKDTIHNDNSNTHVSVLPSKKLSEVLGKPAGFVHFDLHTVTALEHSIIVESQAFLQTSRFSDH